MMLQRNVVDFMRKRLGLADTYTEEEIHRAVGILRCVTIQLYSGSKMSPVALKCLQCPRTNAFQVEHPYLAAQGTSGKAIYPTFSFLSHSCVCNAR